MKDQAVVITGCLDSLRLELRDTGVAVCVSSFRTKIVPLLKLILPKVRRQGGAHIRGGVGTASRNDCAQYM